MSVKFVLIKSPRNAAQGATVYTVNTAHRSEGVSTTCEFCGKTYLTERRLYCHFRQLPLSGHERSEDIASGFRSRVRQVKTEEPESYFDALVKRAENKFRFILPRY